MADNEISISVSNRSQNIDVNTGGGNTQIGISGDNSQYFSNEARKSAERAAQSATEAQNFAEQAENSKDELLNDTGFVAVKDNLDSIITTAVNIEDINTNAENIEAIKNASTIALGKADRDLSNLTSTGEKHFLNKQQITNCLLEVPQRVKLELNDGVLTLKAGSVVTVPNGFEADGTTPKFDEVVIESDKTCLEHTTGTCIVFINDDGDLYANIKISPNTGSGSSAPTDFIGVFYNTTTNTIGARFNTSSQFSSGYSLPVAIVTNSSTTVCSSIDQTFNGMGYMGSTIWVDKGVKGLIPNGRNEDGSLRNIEFTTDSLLSFSEFNNNTSNYAVIDYNGGNLRLMRSLVIITDYDFSNNFIKREDGLLRNSVIVAVVNCSLTGITNFQSKLPFRAVDYSDSSTVSGWAMPSDKYIDLTLGASGSTYTAPTNGYFKVTATATSASVSYIYIGLDNGLSTQLWIPPNMTGNSVHGFIPCKKGQIFTLSYYSCSIAQFIFIYAEGEV